jgi:hypothetical protein
MEDSNFPVETSFDSNTESISVEMTAKGTYKWTIKVRSPTLLTSDVERLKDLDSKLKLEFVNYCK